jgi:diaminopimelate decarboxylase
LVRVTPGVRPDTHAKIATGQAGSKFGLDLEAARAAIDRLRAAPGLRLDGLHVHLGSQILDTEPWLEAVRALASLGDFGTYNLGGGLGVVYERERVPPAIETWVRDVVAFAHAELGAAAKRVMLEPGRSLVANAGVTLYTVTTVKPGWVAVDGGMSDNLRPMLYGAPYQAWLAERMTAAPDTACHVAGKHCESGDVLVHDAALPAPRPGDVLVTPATGAYGHAMANNYNGVPRPPVILCADGDAREVVRRETYADLTARDGV